MDNGVKSNHSILRKKVAWLSVQNLTDVLTKTKIS